MNLGYPFLIFQLCKQARVPITNQDYLLHPIKAIVVRKKIGALVPQPQGIVDSGNESTSDENEEDEDDKQPPPLPPQVPITQDEGTSSSSLHDQINELTMRVYSFWDEHQEFQVSLNQQMEEPRNQNAIIITNQEFIQRQLAQLLSYYAQPPPPPQGGH